jgi:hypothetical protein
MRHATQSIPTGNWSDVVIAVTQGEVSFYSNGVRLGTPVVRSGAPPSLATSVKIQMGGERWQRHPG